MNIIERKIQVLVIEDDLDYVDIIRMCLEEPDSMGLSFEIERADRLELGLKLLDAAPFDALLLDLALPDSRGIETVARVQSRGHDIPILVMTSLGDEKTAFEAMRLGAQDYMVKSTSDSRLLKRAIWYAIERRKLLTQSEMIIRRAPDAMVVVDAAGNARYANPAAEGLFGAAPGLVGRPFPLPLPQESGEARLPGEPERFVEVRVGEIQWQGEPARLAVVRDITELRRLESLKAEVRERRRLDGLKDELIGTVSHELRTPLTIVKGAIDNLKEGIAGELGPKQRAVVVLADRNLSRLSRMINNLLDLSRLESGQARLNRRRFSLAKLLRETIEEFQLAAGEKGLSLTAALPEGLPDVVADSDMIAEVLANLLDNAVRFARGKVTVSARPAPWHGGSGVTVDVVDDGPGVPPDRIGQLFNKFVQINRAPGGAGYRGTGLGLAICKEIMALHDSPIDVESGSGAGARFHFSLPEPSALERRAAEPAIEASKERKT